MWHLTYVPPLPASSSSSQASSSASAGGPPGRPDIYLSPGTVVAGRGFKCGVELCKDNTLSRTHATLRVVLDSRGT